MQQETSDHKLYGGVSRKFVICSTSQNGSINWEEYLHSYDIADSPYCHRKKEAVTKQHILFDYKEMKSSLSEVEKKTMAEKY